MKQQYLLIAVAALLVLACVSERAMADDLPVAEVAEQLTANTVTVRAMADVPREGAADGSTSALRFLQRAMADVPREGAANDQAAPDAAIQPYTADAAQSLPTENQSEPKLTVITPDGQRRAVVVPRDLARSPANVPEVSVGSGVALEGGLIVTVLASRQPTKVRVTLPDGSQAEAEPRVIDTYTGLCLLQVSGAKLLGLPVSAEASRVGETVLTAAASGTEGALVSQGVLSGIDRLVDSELPPLLQSDVRTTETSHGAGLVDRAGRLIGILVTTEAGEERTGWAYALPASHVTRLAKAVVEGELVTLENQRPTIGLKLATDPQGAGVRVLEAFEGMPAREAGIQDGDLLKTIDETHVRQAIQVQAQVLKRAPGDKLAIGYERAGETRQAEVTLGTTTQNQVLQNQALDQGILNQQGQNQAAPRTRFGPQLKVQRVAPNQLEIRNSARATGALPRQALTQQEALLAADEAAVVAKLRSLEQVVETLQMELTRRAHAQAEDQKRLGVLTEQIEHLRQRLSDQPAKAE